MKIAENTLMTNAAALESEFPWSTSLAGPMTHRTYHELSDTPVIETDVMSALENSVTMLEDLHGRMAFMMREVTYLLKA